ncbi:unnamed protein product [Echinostoma caproni]|uniref:N-acetylgalactosaminide beta-1,3-galactosyltransferase n=1 Tax=Echinostoma caproni TaxID=27848 RepID=A0A183AUF7_9TREM|nr:unnamed protein product [Echinostoma caproni]
MALPNIGQRPRLNLTKPETRMHLWYKMRKILRQIYTERDNFDYFFKADDDTYAVMENLRHAIYDDSPEIPFMTGYRWNALKRIVELAIDKHPDCPTTDEDKEDVKMCLCGRAVGVDLLDTAGSTGKSAFYPYSVEHYYKHHMQSGMVSE